MSKKDKDLLGQILWALFVGVVVGLVTHSFWIGFVAFISYGDTQIRLVSIERKVCLLCNKAGITDPDDSH